MAPTADDALFEKVRAFVGRELCDDPAAWIVITRLQHDLGVDGDTGVELLEASAKELVPTSATWSGVGTSARKG